MKTTPKTNRTTAHPEAHCPHCGHTLTRATDPGDNAVPFTPKRGDLSICYYCVNPLRFAGTKSKPKFEPVDLAKLHPTNRLEIAHLQNQIRAQKAAKN